MSNGILDLPGPQTARVRFAAAMAAATTDDETVAFIVPAAATGIKITGVKWTPDAAVTANGTNFTIVSVRNRTTGAGATLVATRSYAATNSVAYVSEAMTMSATAADALCAAGDVITVQRIHTATGVVVPAGSIEITYTLR